MDFLLNSIENYFNININQNKRAELKKKYKILNVKDSLEKFKSFNEFDEQTHFHGNHISKYLGTPNYYKNLLPQTIKDIGQILLQRKKYLNYE